jgi:hypothetical protein
MTISLVSGCMGKNSQTTPTIVITILTAALVAAVVVVVAAISTAAQNNNNSAIAQQQGQNQAIYRIQETAMSTAAPVAHTGNLPHMR